MPADEENGAKSSPAKRGRGRPVANPAAKAAKRPAAESGAKKGNQSINQAFLNEIIN